MENEDNLIKCEVNIGTLLRNLVIIMNKHIGDPELIGEMMATIISMTNDVCIIDDKYQSELFPTYCQLGKYVYAIYELDHRVKADIIPSHVTPENPFLDIVFNDLMDRIRKNVKGFINTYADNMYHTHSINSKLSKVFSLVYKLYY